MLLIKSILSFKSALFGPSTGSNQPKMDLEEAQQSGLSRLAVHRVNLYRPLPTSINCMALSPCKRFLAVIRGFANVRAALERLTCPVCTIEIYKIYGGVSIPTVCILKIHQLESLQSIAWFDEASVVTVSINQNINIYSTKTGKLLFQEMSDYGPIYCLKHEPSMSLLFTGTEYGYVNVYKCNYEKMKISFLKVMVKVPNRILSLDCYIKEIDINKRPKMSKKKTKRRKKSPQTDSSDSSSSSSSDDDLEQVGHDVKVFGGSLGDVVVWDLRTGSISETIHIGDEAVVWALLTTKNGEIVIGDSTGATSIYDANSLTCKQRVSLHTADVLCLAKTENENEIFISGIDNVIRSIAKYADNDMWVPKTKRHIHTHDVRSLATYKDTELFSGGSDFFLAHSCYPDAKKTFFMPNLTENLKFSNPDELMMQNEASLIIWKLAGYDLDGLSKHVSGYALQMNSEPQKIVELRTRSFILTSTFNDSWICYYTIGASNISLYRRSQEFRRLVRYRLSTKLIDCYKMEIVEFDDLRFLLAINPSSISLIDLESESEEEESCVVSDEIDFSHNALQIVQIDSNIIVSSSDGDQSYISLLTVDSEHKLQLISKLNAGLHSISFVSAIPSHLQEKKDTLFVYTQEGIILRVDLMDFRITETCEVILPEHSTMMGMFFISHNGTQQLALYDYKNIFKLNLIDGKYHNTTAITRYNHILKIINTGNRGGTDEICLIELTPEQLAKLLPPVLKKRKFGC